MRRKKNKHSIKENIYIYIERERERERESKGKEKGEKKKNNLNCSYNCYASREAIVLIRGFVAKTNAKEKCNKHT